MIKLICTDIDGTFLNKQREVDTYTKEVFKKLNGRFATVLASSRMPKALYHIQNSLGIEAMPLICYNGALMLSEGKGFDNGKIINSVIITPEIVQTVLDLTQFQNVHISIYYNNTWIASGMDFWAEREINNTRVKPDSLFDALSKTEMKENIKKGAHKIMIMGDKREIDFIETNLEGKQTVALCRSKETYLEITPNGTNKSLGLRDLLNHVGDFKNVMMENVMAFGDNHNDYELLSDVKYGIAVENSIQKLKDIAFATTKTNYDNGVAFYLNEYFLKNDGNIG